MCIRDRCDGDDHAQQRLALGVDPPLPAMWRDVAREGLAIVIQRGGCTEVQHVSHAAGFMQAVLAAQAGLSGDQRTDLVAPGDHGRRGALQDLGTLEALSLIHI